MRGNTVQIELPLKRGKVSKTIPLYQYDYGQNLVITGAELPDAYEVHFANEMHGEAVTAIGGSTGVAIPDSVLTSGEPIYLWLYLHEDSTDGETEFQGVIPVIKRASISDQEPTPAEQSAITEAIAALNAAVTATGEAQTAAEAAASQIVNMSVEAEAASGSSPTVTKGTDGSGNVKLTFGLVKGDKGDKGDTGDQGETGNPGADGADGVSPSVSVTSIAGGHRVSITDASGTDTFDVMDGDPTEIIDDTAGDGDTDKTWSADKLYEDFAGKADLVGSATNGNFAALDSNGNLTDSGHKHSDYLTSHQDISGKSDLTNLAAAFSSSSTYAVGDHVTYDGKYYVCSTAISTAGAWDSSKWTETKIGGEFSSLKSEINGKYEKPNTGIPSSDMTDAVQTSLGKADSAYQKPQTGIPLTDLADNTESVSGTTPSITGVAGHRYICGECATLSITAPASGCIDVLFESGSTATVLTVTSAKTGVSAIKWANGFDPTSLDASTTYELNILDGEFGVVGSWT